MGDEIKVASATEVSMGSRDGSRGNDDDTQLARLGKQPVLKRTFGYASMLGFSCTVLVTWEGTLLTFQTAFTEGGSAGTVYTFILVWLGMLCTYICLAELASMAPTAGGQYHWVAMLAPRRYQKFLSYLAGWLTLTGWQANNASGAFNSGLLIQGLIGLTNSSYKPSGWHVTLIAWSILLFAVLINTGATSSLAKFEGMILVLHVIGFFAVLIPLVYLGPHGSAHDVFATFVNSGGWSSQSLGFFIGLVGPVYAFVGADSATHMAEEVKNASVIIPRAILVTILLNGALGFAMLIALLFSIGDPAANGPGITGSTLGFPFIQVFLNATKSVSGAAIMASLVLVLGISSTVGLLASSSRMFWAFSRDRALPLWGAISKVNSRTSIPVTAVVTTTTISALLALIGIGSSVAFNDIISITVVGLYASYILVLVLLLWRRVSGDIKDPYAVAVSDDDVIHLRGQLIWGPFRMPSRVGIAVNALAVAYLMIVFFFAFWPPAQPVTTKTMNYSCLVFGTVVIFSCIWYVVYGRKVYEGPVVDRVPASKLKEIP